MLILVASSAVLILQSLLFFITKSWIADLYTKDSNVTSVVLQTFPIIVIELVINGVSQVLFGPIMALGKQKTATANTFCAYYIFGLPAAIILALHAKMGVYGAWLGILLGVST